MSKSDENNSCLLLKNNSSQNLSLSLCNKNKSNNLFDSASNIINVQLLSPNNSKNSETKERNNSEIMPINKEKSQKNQKKIEDNINKEELKKEEENINNLLSPFIKDDKSKELNIKLMKENNHKCSKLDQNSLKKLNNIRKKITKISEQHSVNTPKQILSVYDGRGMAYNLKKGNILVKKNMKLGIQKDKNSPNNINKKITNENKGNIMYENNRNKNNYVKYINNDKYNFNGNILNMTQNYNQAKYALSQSKSFTKVEKKNSILGISNSNNNINKNNLKNPNFNYIEYNNYKSGLAKKKELTVLIKNNSTYRNNNKKENKNNINSFVFQNISTSPNSNTQIQSYFNYISKKCSPKNGMSSKTANNMNRSKKRVNGGNKSNELKHNNINPNFSNSQKNSNKNIFFMKPAEQKKRRSYGKNNEISLNNKDNTTNQSSFGSKNKKDYKTTIDSTFLNDVINRNIDNPEELHFFYIKILQNGKEISKKFEIDNI